MRIFNFRGYKDIVGVTGLEVSQIKNPDEIVNNMRSVCKGVNIQLLSPDYIAGFDHVYFGVLNVLQAFKNGYNLSKNYALEILLYCSAQRQITKAIKHLGIKSNQKEVIIIVFAISKERIINCIANISKALNALCNDSIIKISSPQKLENIKFFFQIEGPEITATQIKNSNELEVIQKLVIERVAILSTLI